MHTPAFGGCENQLSFRSVHLLSVLEREAALTLLLRVHAARMMTVLMLGQTNVR